MSAIQLSEQLTEREARVSELEAKLAALTRQVSTLSVAEGKEGGDVAGASAGWKLPSGRPSGIMVNNTLNTSWGCGCHAGEGEQDLVPFIPKKEGEVKFYICGPTVYDSAHVGHARAYLTFDILRNILENFFGYNVMWVMNITDIDDKIILRSRQNHLIKEYEAELASGAVDFATFVADMGEAVVGAMAKAEGQAEPSIKVKRVAEATALGAVVAAAKGAAAAAQAGARAEILETGRSALGELLDARKGLALSPEACQAIFQAHARHFEADYFNDMESLGVRRPDVVTRVTEYVPQVVTSVSEIIANGFAYESNGSVYFDTEAFKAAGHEYPKLVPPGGNDGKDDGEEDDAVAKLIAEGEGALAAGDSEKQHPHDFALWKKSKGGEPRWESPWGLGRPGWHIECSVMASDVIGETMDIHAGGIDLKFPHHENEMAQAEANFNHHQWVNYFLHAGHLNIDGLKMSKSLKNFISIKGVLDNYTGNQLRMMFLTQQWDKPMSYSESSMATAKDVERKFYEFFQNVRVLLRNQTKDSLHSWGAVEKALYASLEAKQAVNRDHLCNNFNTSGVVGELQALMKETAKYMKGSEGNQPRHLLVLSIARYITKMFSCFGLTDESIYNVGFGGGGGGGGASKEEVTAPILDAFVSFRDNVRAAAISKAAPGDILGMCDEVRDTSLIDLGVRLEDQGKGQTTTWKMEDPKVLKLELARKVEEAERKRAEKAEKAAAREAEAAAKAKQMSVDPAVMFKSGEFKAEYAGKWTAWDEKGLPTKLADGSDVPKSASKKLTKELNKQTKDYAKWVKAQGGEEKQ